jgi:hypothetical protein
MLPAGVSGAAAQAEEHPLFSFRGGRGGRRLPSVPALPSGSVAGDAGVVGRFLQRLARVEIDRQSALDDGGVEISPRDWESVPAT